VLRKAWTLPPDYWLVAHAGKSLGADFGLTHMSGYWVVMLTRHKLGHGASCQENS
jgi:hypothetical protein